MSGRAIVVRAARASDIDAVLAIEQSSFVDPWSRDSFETAVELDRMQFLVAEGSLVEERAATDSHQRDVLGFVVVLLLFDEAEIADLAVLKAARGRGIGGLLLDHATSKAQAMGVQSLYLEVRESNASARALYDSRSFTHVGRRRAYYRTPTEDALLMRREL